MFLLKLTKVFYWKLPPALFILAFNFRRIQLKSSVRLARGSNPKIFKLKDSLCNLEWRCHRDRLTLYSEGLLARATAFGEAYGLQHVEILDGDLIVDCGANMGDMQLYLYLIRKKKVRYIAFEPSPLDFICLEKNRIIPGAVHQIALFNLNSEIKFYLDSKNANSSLIEPPYFTNKVMVQAARLDSLIGKQKVKLLKIEAEGGEPEVLEGATGIVNQIKYICVDAGPERGIYQYDTLKEVELYFHLNAFQEIGRKSGYRRIFQNLNHN